VIRNGARSGSGPLDSLGPLVVQRRTRLAGSGDNKRTVVEYAVHAAEHSRIDLYVTDTPTEARRRMQRLARSWRVSCKSYGGTVLGPRSWAYPSIGVSRPTRRLAPRRASTPSGAYA